MFITILLIILKLISLVNYHKKVISTIIKVSDVITAVASGIVGMGGDT